MEYGILATLHLIAIIYAVLQIFSSNAGILGKILWSLGVVAFPVVGFVVWLLIGPRGTALKT
ncbi:PLDc N-terminal domain-containing protein [Sulfitobacter guttiformis]|uniref:Phospholipase D-like protein n=1 Tax=Sulfitobacter guttiformis TaxID=74349 RepID=A0A420DT98_9RHOB|nr:PLDc N-terminal domain-containing protein [Sulfitobacter guttiformis]KIN74906.1 hypothetical protein Z949_4112 [Sulfitobacter guttiformis KCTC 32187]RKE97472.1 phospholipase D-like protein [Sulfitobacter guttiformis]